MEKFVAGLQGELLPEYYSRGNVPEGLGEEFFKAVPQIRMALKEDLLAAFRGDPAAESLEEVAACYPGFYGVTVYRIAHRLYEMGVPILPRRLTEWAHRCTGIDIHPGAVIGPGFFIDHGTGVVIGQTAVLGRDVTLYHGVTLGALSTRGGRALKGVKRHPTLEDGVTVYANATVLGGDTVIGRNCVIGANAFVTSSVPPETVVTAK